MAKLAFISTMEGASWGGSEELWSQTALRLKQQGHFINANVRAWPSPVVQVSKLVEAGCQVELRTTPGRLQRITRRISAQSEYDWLNRVQPDLAIISQGGHIDGVNWAEECAKRKINYVLIAQAAAVEWWPDDELARREAKSYEGARASYFVSQSNLDLAKQQFCSALPNARVVRNPFNVSYDAASTWPVDDGGVRIACVGRLHLASKGQDLLLSVLQKEKWRLRRLHVTFIGKGPNDETLRMLSEKYELDSVSFGGFQDDIESLWKQQHALILPSRYEGLPLAIVEAMLCGRLCIVTNVAGNAEIVEDNQNGFVAAAPTVDLLDEGMERAWQRRAEWQQIGQKASTRVRELVPRDPIDVFAKELLHLLP